MNKVLLSHFLNADTPTYGGKNRPEITKLSDIKKGGTANNTLISMSLHTGTHVDMPCHFFDGAQTVKDFPAGFWFFEKPLFLSISPESEVINHELISVLTGIDNKASYDCIIVKTGFDRYNSEELMKNPGFHADTANFMRDNFANVRLFGFDSISVSSFAAREAGREAHKAFLNPDRPIVLLEDMNLKDTDRISRLCVMPLMVENADGLPATVIGEI